MMHSLLAKDMCKYNAKKLHYKPIITVFSTDMTKILRTPGHSFVINNPLIRTLSTTPNQTSCNEDGSKLSNQQLLKNAVRDYGSTVMVFHVTISLASLAGFYTAVSRYTY